MRDPLIVLEELALHELVTLARVQETDEFIDTLPSIEVGLVIISLVDGLSWTFQTANIHASCWASVVLQELSQVIQLVTKVMCSLIFDFK